MGGCGRCRRGGGCLGDSRVDGSDSWHGDAQNRLLAPRSGRGRIRRCCAWRRLASAWRLPEILALPGGLAAWWGWSHPDHGLRHGRAARARLRGLWTCRGWGRRCGRRSQADNGLLQLGTSTRAVRTRHCGRHPEHGLLERRRRRVSAGRGRRGTRRGLRRSPGRRRWCAWRDRRNPEHGLRKPRPPRSGGTSGAPGGLSRR